MITVFFSFTSNPVCETKKVQSARPSTSIGRVQAAANQHKKKPELGPVFSHEMTINLFCIWMACIWAEAKTTRINLANRSRNDFHSYQPKNYKWMSSSNSTKKLCREQRQMLYINNDIRTPLATPIIMCYVCMYLIERTRHAMLLLNIFKEIWEESNSFCLLQLQC